MTPELVPEGLARDVVRVIQDRRKDLGCEYTDRIAVGIVTSDPRFARPLNDSSDDLAKRRWPLHSPLDPIAGVEKTAVQVAGQSLDLYVKILA